MAQLEKPQSERRRNRGLELLQRLRAVLREFVIKPHAPGQHAERQARDQTPIGGRKIRQAMAQQDIGECSMRFNPNEDFGRYAARREPGRLPASAVCAAQAGRARLPFCFGRHSP